MVASPKEKNKTKPRKLKGTKPSTQPGYLVLH